MESEIVNIKDEFHRILNFAFEDNAYKKEIYDYVYGTELPNHIVDELNNWEVRYIELKNRNYKIRM
jgi:hypothetical protein